MKIVTIIGARPQFVKAAALSRKIKEIELISEVLVHTGQHYDNNMSALFFEELEIPEPKYNLGIHSMNHGAMTGRMMEELEKILITEDPDWVLVYGDTNSTLAGALAAKKLNIKIAHIEAGLRSFNYSMPEEINRILTDRISDVLFCPTRTAVENLKEESFNNFPSKVRNVGDIMYDAALYFSTKDRSKIDIGESSYVLATIHRAENTNSRDKLTNIFKALDNINKEKKIILPLHPRTKSYLEKYNIQTSIKLIEPVGYMDMVSLIKGSSFVITDSGGLQKEAYFFEKPCFTFRDETEWVELVKSRCNMLVDVLAENISESIFSRLEQDFDFSEKFYGYGDTSTEILNTLLEFEHETVS